MNVLCFLLDDINGDLCSVSFHLCHGYKHMISGYDRIGWTDFILDRINIG